MTVFTEEVIDAKGNMTDIITYGSEGIITWKVYSEALVDWIPLSLDTLRIMHTNLFIKTEDRLNQKYDDKLNQVYQRMEDERE